MPETIAFKGDFTVNELSESIPRIKEALALCNELLIDASGVDTTDCAALQMLVAAQKECALRGGSLTVRKSEGLARRAELLGIPL